MLGVLLALSGSLMWGFADYLGGLQTRSHKVLSVVVISQTAGLIVISAVVALRGVGWPGVEAMLPAAGGGALASICIVIFYLALSYGPISIVAPVLASSACIPVVYGLARAANGRRPCNCGHGSPRCGRRPGLLDARRRPRARSSRHRLRRARRRAPRHDHGALLARLGGRSVLGLVRAARDLDLDDQTLHPRSAQRARVDRRGIAIIACIGVLDMLANLAYSVATTLQLLAITAVLQLAVPGRDGRARPHPSRRARHARPAGRLGDDDGGRAARGRRVTGRGPNAHLPEVPATSP